MLSLIEIMRRRKKPKRMILKIKIRNHPPMIHKNKMIKPRTKPRVIPRTMPTRSKMAKMKTKKLKEKAIKTGAKVMVLYDHKNYRQKSLS